MKLSRLFADIHRQLHQFQLGHRHRKFFDQFFDFWSFNFFLSILQFDPSCDERFCATIERSSTFVYHLCNYVFDIVAARLGRIVLLFESSTNSSCPPFADVNRIGIRNHKTKQQHVWKYSTARRSQGTAHNSTCTCNCWCCAKCIKQR